MSDYILELKNIGKTFSGVNVLRDVNLQLKKGEVHVLLGENGAGKSTLIKIISGYHAPDKGGEIYVMGEKKEFTGPKQPKDAGIHTIYQELTLCKDMTVAENIVIDKQDQFKGFMLKGKEFRKIATDGFFNALDGKKIHYVYYKAENAKGNIVISHGFTESAEKFLEMCYYFNKMTLNVFIVDHRGHGLSHRHNSDKEVVHIKYFDQYVDDLQKLVKVIVRAEAPGLPLYLFSHSMGGAIAVQHMQKYPGVFSKAILSAPMIQAKTAGLPPAVAKFFTRLFILLGKEKEKVIGYKGFNPERTYEDSHDTSKERFDYYHRKKIENEDIRTAAPSNRWVNEAVKVTERNLDPTRNKKIKRYCR